jgi:hypothetical protein
MIASKRVAEGRFGREAVARFAETRIVAGDPQKCEFFLARSASETLNFHEAPYRLIGALRWSPMGPDSLVEAREPEHRMEK